MSNAENCVLAEKHLRFLYGQAALSDGLIAIYSKKPHAVEFFSIDAIRQAAEFALQLSETRDVYHLVNLISPRAMDAIRGRHGRGREAELKSVVAFVCEIDTCAGLHRETDYPSQEISLRALSEMPLSPSVVNLSGQSDGGLHVYWVLEQPVCVSDATAKRRIKVISKAWQERLRDGLSPYRLDSTFDLVRVLRVPVCRNHKYEGAVTRPLVVEDRRYRLEEFARRVEPREEESVATHGKEPTLGESTRLERCRNYLQRIPEAISGQQGHNKTFRAACECFRFGLSRRDAEELMAWFNDEKTSAEDKWSAAELEHKLETAERTVKDAGEFGVRVSR